MELYNPNDVAIELIRDTSEISKSLFLDDMDAVRDCEYGEIKMVGDDVRDVEIGQKCYIDPIGMVVIEALNLAVVPEKNILIVEDK